MAPMFFIQKAELVSFDYTFVVLCDARVINFQFFNVSKRMICMLDKVVSQFE